jgi:hypothetical protein
MSYLSMRQLNAFWVLGWALVKHIIARPFVGRRLPQPWLDRLGQEQLGPVPERAWELFAPSARCIACGLCDALGAPGDTPMQWILSVARTPADAAIVGPALARLAALAGPIEQICPARLSVHNLVELATENARLGGRA